jgi:CorA-like Mg2+ transporter protein
MRQASEGLTISEAAAVGEDAADSLLSGYWPSPSPLPSAAAGPSHTSAPAAATAVGPISPSLSSAQPSPPGSTNDGSSKDPLKRLRIAAGAGGGVESSPSPAPIGGSLTPAASAANLLAATAMGMAGGPIGGLAAAAVAESLLQQQQQQGQQQQRSIGTGTASASSLSLASALSPSGAGGFASGSGDGNRRGSANLLIPGAHDSYNHPLQGIPGIHSASSTLNQQHQPHLHQARPYGYSEPTFTGSNRDLRTTSNNDFLALGGGGVSDGGEGSALSRKNTLDSSEGQPFVPASSSSSSHRQQLQQQHKQHGADYYGHDQHHGGAGGTGNPALDRLLVSLFGSSYVEASMAEGSSAGKKHSSHYDYEGDGGGHQHRFTPSPPLRAPSSSHQHQSAGAAAAAAAAAAHHHHQQHHRGHHLSAAASAIKGPFITELVTTFLQSRDLRVVDSGFELSREPSVLVRRHCIVINLPPVRAIILPDKCFFFPEEGADAELLPILKRLSPGGGAAGVGGAPSTAAGGSGDVVGSPNALEAGLPIDARNPNPSPVPVALVGTQPLGISAAGTGAGLPANAGAGAGGAGAGATAANAGVGAGAGGSEMPWEFFVLETFLIAVTTSINDEAKYLGPEVQAITRKLVSHSSTNPKMFEQLRRTKRKLGDFLSRLKAFHRVLSDLLDTQEDVRSLALSTILDAERASATLHSQAVALAAAAEAQQLLLQQQEQEQSAAAEAEASPPATAAVPAVKSEAAPQPPVGTEAEGPKVSWQFAEKGGEHTTPSRPAPSARGRGTTSESALLSPKQSTSSAMDRLRRPPSSSVAAITAALSHILTSSTEALLDDNEDTAEVLLESYLAEIEGVISRAKLLREDLESGESQLNLVLANNRNRLLKTEIGITTVTMCMTACAVVSGYFGQNLNNQLEDSYSAFLAVTIGTTCGAFLVAVLLGLYLRSILR